MRIEILDEAGEVVNVIAGDEAFAQEHYPGRWRAAGPQDAPAPAARHITKLAFRNRFSPTEKASLELAALDNPTALLPARQQSAALRASLADQRDATYIDLDRADTRGGVQALEASGILAGGRALQILDAPVQDAERYRT